jgi:hypothetical protein
MNSLLFTGHKSSLWRELVRGICSSLQEELDRKVQEPIEAKSLSVYLATELEKPNPKVVACPSHQLDMEEFLKKAPSTRVVYFYDGPMDFVRAECSETEGQNPLDALDRWKVGVDGLFSVAKRSSGRIQLLQRHLALENPDVFAKWLHQNLGILLPDFPSISATPAKADLSVVFTELAIRRDGSLRRRIDEANVLCCPIFESRPSSILPGANLLEVWTECTASHVEMENKCRQLQAQARNAKEKYEQSLTQLHQTQDELEHYFLACKGMQNAPEQGDASKDCELLLTQLHHVQDELEHYFLACKGMQNAPEQVSRGFRCLSLQGIQVVSSHLEGEHQHLSFQLACSEAGLLFPEGIEVRLADHVGNPGLVVLRPEGEASPAIIPWRKDGSEGEREYMLIFPRNPEHAKFLVESTATSLARLLDLLDAMELALHSEEERFFLDPLSPNTKLQWCFTLRRLKNQFAALPQRLHYDDVKSELDEAEGFKSLSWTIAPILFGDCFHPSLGLCWQVKQTAEAKGASGKILFRCSGGTIPPFDAWPLEDQNRLAQEWAPSFLDFSTNQPSARSAWRALGHSDRRIILGILAEMPNLLVHSSRLPEGKKIQVEALLPQLRSAHQILKKLGQVRKTGVLRSVSRLFKK